MKVKVIGPKDKEKLPDEATLVYTVSRASGWSKGLSPFYLGPCELYGGLVSQNVENGWQYSKVYACHADENKNPTKDYWEWAKEGWANKRAQRYPMGKGAKPLYCYWDGKKLGYIEARSKVYVKLYGRAALKSDAYKKLRELYVSEPLIYLWDFDGYDNEKLGMSLKDVLNDPTKTMGHAFVLAKLLESGL